MSNYDLVVIGAGPGGYVAAIRAAQKGKKVAVIEKKAIGGTCLNVGCIPSKSYLKHAHWILSAQEANHFGFNFQNESFSFERLVQRKDQVVKKLQGGIHHLFQTNNIDYIEGEAHFDQQKELVVGEEKIGYQDVLLATGGHPFVPPIPGLDQVAYLTTDSFFALTELPEKLVIIGGGVIAVELAFAMQPLGVAVTLIEVAPDILLTEEPEARKVIKKKLQSLGIEVIIQAKISTVTKQSVILEDGSQKNFDQLLIAAGRKANLALAEQLGLTMAEGKFVAVDQHYQTSEKNIYAIGDLIGGLQLAHAASAEGMRAVNAICKLASYPVDPTTVPRCLYTDPEVASFGLTEEAAREAYEDVYTKTVSFSGNGKAIAAEETEGFVKIISEKKYHQILGAVIVGSHATEMIHTILAVKETEGTVDELSEMIFAHPTMSEIIGETANGLLGKAIHG